MTSQCGSNTWIFAEFLKKELHDNLEIELHELADAKGGDLW